SGAKRGYNRRGDIMRFCQGVQFQHAEWSTSCELEDDMPHDFVAKSEFWPTCPWRNKSRWVRPGKIGRRTHESRLNEVLRGGCICGPIPVVGGPKRFKCLGVRGNQLRRHAENSDIRPQPKLMIVQDVIGEIYWMKPGIGVDTVQECSGEYQGNWPC